METNNGVRSLWWPILKSESDVLLKSGNFRAKKILHVAGCQSQQKESSSERIKTNRADYAKSGMIFVKTCFEMKKLKDGNYD